MIRRCWPVLPACCILIAAAAAHGLRTDRWGATDDLAVTAARLDAIPLKIGDWEGVTIDLPPEQVKAAHVSGLFVRRYTHRYTRAEVLIMLLCGRPGPVSVHTPDVCYSAVGFVMGPSRTEPTSDGNVAWVADFKNSGPQPQTLRIRWAWSTGGAWTASNSPRTEFSRSRVLYKLYLIRSVPTGGDPAENLPELALLRDLLPSLQNALSAQ